MNAVVLIFLDSLQQCCKLLNGDVILLYSALFGIAHILSVYWACFENDSIANSFYLAVVLGRAIEELNSQTHSVRISQITSIGHSNEPKIEENRGFDLLLKCDNIFINLMLEFDK